MKRLFGFLLFVIGAALFIATVAAFFAMGFETILVASIVISVFLLVAGFVLTYEEQEDFSEEELEHFKQNGSISDRLGQL